MKSDFLLRNGAASAQVRAGEHTHDHAHDHSHQHDHDHGTHTHSPAHAAKTPPAIPASDPRSSLLMSSAPLRLAGAVMLIVLLWAAVAWALSGTP
jgi:hypothetical protein